jgi:AraC-like DNA-binding protein
MLNDNYGMDLEYISRFIKIIIILNSISNEENNTYLPNNNMIIERITEYINTNIANKILIEDIASFLALSISRVSHIFKQETGISILKYINKKRLMLAKELIRQGETFINIAHKCGFQDYTSFFRAFKKEYNLTPGEYLKAVNLFQA